MPTQQEDNKKNTFNRLKDKQFWTNVGFSVTLILAPTIVFALVKEALPLPSGPKAVVNVILDTTTDVLKGAAVGNMVRHIRNED